MYIYNSNPLPFFSFSFFRCHKHKFTNPCVVGFPHHLHVSSPRRPIGYSQISIQHNQSTQNPKTPIKTQIGLSSHTQDIAHPLILPIPEWQISQWYHSLPNSQQKMYGQLFLKSHKSYAYRIELTLMLLTQTMLFLDRAGLFLKIYKFPMRERRICSDRDRFSIQWVRASMKQSSEAIDSRWDRKSGKGVSALLSNSNWLLWGFQHLIFREKFKPDSRFVFVFFGDVQHVGHVVMLDMYNMHPTMFEPHPCPIRVGRWYSKGWEYLTFIVIILLFPTL